MSIEKAFQDLLRINGDAAGEVLLKAAREHSREMSQLREQNNELQKEVAKLKAEISQLHVDRMRYLRYCVRHG
jgi:cell division protein FtsB